MNVTHIYYVYEYQGNDDHDIKKYKACKLITVETKLIENGIICQPVYVDMMRKAKEEIAEENNLDVSEVDYNDIIITFWSEIRHG